MVDKSNQELVIRYFEVKRKLSGYDFKTYVSEVSRVLLNGSRRKPFNLYRFYDKEPYGVDWHTSKLTWVAYYQKHYNYSNSITYTRNINKVLKNTEFEHSALYDFTKKDEGCECCCVSSTI